MAETDGYYFSQEDYDSISNGGTFDITVKPVYDTTPPAGWTLVAEGPGGSFVLCAKPCNSVKLAPPSQQ